MIEAGLYDADVAPGHMSRPSSVQSTILATDGLPSPALPPTLDV
jgi:hypothetical protein